MFRSRFYFYVFAIAIADNIFMCIDIAIRMIIFATN